MSLDDYVCSGITTEMDNDQVRLISGVGGQIKFGECSRKHLEDAQENIRNHFCMAGISERFDETLLLIKKEPIREDRLFCARIKYFGCFYFYNRCDQKNILENPKKGCPIKEVHPSAAKSLVAAGYILIFIR
jgi:hypothetical protein